MRRFFLAVAVLLPLSGCDSTTQPADTVYGAYWLQPTEVEGTVITGNIILSPGHVYHRYIVHPDRVTHDRGWFIPSDGRVEFLEGGFVAEVDGTTLRYSESGTELIWHRTD